MTFAEYLLCLAFYFLGVYLAYGAMLHERLETVPQNVAPWEQWALAFNALLSWPALVLMLFAAHNEDRMFDYQFTVPDDRIWREGDD